MRRVRMTGHIEHGPHDATDDLDFVGGLGPRLLVGGAGVCVAGNATIDFIDRPSLLMIIIPHEALRRRVTALARGAGPDGAQIPACGGAGLD